MPTTNPSGIVTFSTDEIRDMILRDTSIVTPTVNTSQGKDAWTDATVLAGVLAPVYANGEYLAQQIFPETADPQVYLPLHAAIDGVAKLGAQLNKMVVTPLAASFSFIAISDETQKHSQAQNPCAPADGESE